jgi:hypothetical protein
VESPPIVTVPACAAVPGTSRQGEFTLPTETVFAATVVTLSVSNGTVSSLFPRRRS